MIQRLRAPRTGFRPLFVLFAGLLATGLLVAGCGGSGPVELPERVVVIAVESLSLDQVDRMLAADELPVLGRLIEQGSRAEIRAADPLDPMMLWASAFTGKAPNLHQMMGEFVPLPSGATSRPPSSMRQAKNFLQIASDAGETVVGVGLPGTWPVEVVDGAMVAPAFVPNRWTQAAEHDFDEWLPEMSVFPVGLTGDLAPLIRRRDELPREEIADFFRLRENEYQMVYDDPLGSIRRIENPLADIAITYQRDASFVDMFAMLSQRFRPAVAGIHLELLEPVQRAYWVFQRPDTYTTPADSRRRFRFTVKTAYERIDAQIGEILATLPEKSTVIVVGERGFGDGPDPNDVEGGNVVPQNTNQSLMVLWGHGIERGVDLGVVSLEDVTPTLLRMSGVHLGSDMTGRVLTDAITDDFEAAHPRRTVPSHDEEWDQRARYPASEGHTRAPSDTTRTETP